MRRLVVIVVLVAAAASVLWIMRIRMAAPPPPEEAGGMQPVRTVTVYFGSQDATALVPEQRTIQSSGDTPDNIRTVIESLIGGPREGGVATFPASVRLRGVFLADKTAVIDFSGELVDDLSGGTAAEYMLISSLVQTVCANFPQVEAVRILVDGEEVETVGGHLSTAGPLQPRQWR